MCAKFEASNKKRSRPIDTNRENRAPKCRILRHVVSSNVVKRLKELHHTHFICFKMLHRYCITNKHFLCIFVFKIKV